MIPTSQIKLLLSRCILQHVNPFVTTTIHNHLTTITNRSDIHQSSLYSATTLHKSFYSFDHHLVSYLPMFPQFCNHHLQRVLKSCILKVQLFAIIRKLRKIHQNSQNSLQSFAEFLCRFLQSPISFISALAQRQLGGGSQNTCINISVPLFIVLFQVISSLHNNNLFIAQ